MTNASDAAVAPGDVTPPVARADTAKSRRRPTVLRRFGRFMNDLFPYFSVGFLVAVLVTLYYWNTVIVVIRSGEAGALYRLFQGGTVTDYVYPEGLHILWPWNSMHIYNTRIQTVLHEFSVLTNKGLPIHLKLAIRYHPEYEMVGLLHQKVGPNYVNTIVVPQIESVLRKNIGKNDPEDIYTNKEGILTTIIVKAIEEAGQKFVFIEDIIIRSVELPTEVKDAIAEKLVHQQKERAYEFRLEAERREAERKAIEAEGIRAYQDTIAKTLTRDLLDWHGINATLEISKSENAKVVVIGSGEKGMPLILNTGEQP